MTKEEYLKTIKELNRGYIKEHRRYKDSQIVWLKKKKVVIVRASGVSHNGEVQYHYREILPDGTLEPYEFFIYGYEWEEIRPTKDFYAYPDEDIL